MCIMIILVIPISSTLLSGSFNDCADCTEPRHPRVGIEDDGPASAALLGMPWPSTAGARWKWYLTGRAVRYHFHPVPAKTPSLRSLSAHPRGGRCAALIDV